MLRRIFVLALLGAASPALSQEKPAPIPLEEAAALFGSRPYVQQISISPDGGQVTYVSPFEDRGALLYIAAVGAPGAPKPIFRSSGDPERIDNCHWVSNKRLLCQAYAATLIGDSDVTYATRFFAINADGSDLKVLQTSRGAGTRLDFDLDGGSVIDWLPDEDNSVLMVRNYIPESTAGTLLAQQKEGLGVDAVDTINFKTRNVERPRPSAREYYTDGTGQVRIMGVVEELSSGYEKNLRRYLYRKKGSRDWETLSVVNGSDSDFDPYGVDPDLDIAYGLKKLNGRYAAYSKALDGSGTETLVFARPDVDVSGFVRVGRNRRIIGASFVTDRREVAFFDPTIDRLTTALGKALPQLPQVQVVDASRDGSRLLVWAGSDIDAGRHYVYDKTSRQLMELILSRPWLEERTMAGMTHMSYPARDGTSVPGYLSLPVGVDPKGLPAIVMPHGGPGARDEWGFDWLVQFFVSQGYAVLQPNFRGSAGYGDAWFRRNGFQDWKTAVSDVNDAGRWLVGQGIADPSRLSIVGWSYGGYAALQSSLVDPDLFKSVVAIAPVTDLAMLKDESRNFTNFLVVQEIVGSGTHIEEGSPARHARGITAPVLLFHGTRDSNVSYRQSRLMEDRLKSAGKPVELVLFDKLDHYLEDSKVRVDMLSRIARFIERP